MTPANEFLLLVAAALCVFLLYLRLRPRRYYFGRHGETLLNKQHIKQGAEGGLSEEGKQQAEVVGAALGQALERLHQKYEIIGEVRGRGLMQAIELVRDRRTREPAAAETAAIFERTREAGIVVSKSGAHRNILRMAPPLCLGLEDIPTVEAALDDCFARASAA